LPEVLPGLQRLDFDLNIADCLNSWHDFEDTFDTIHDSEDPTTEWHQTSMLLYRLCVLGDMSTIDTIHIHIIWMKPFSMINPDYDWAEDRVQRIQESFVRAFTERVPARRITSSSAGEQA
jgi:hypothetical protein